MTHKAVYIDRVTVRNDNNNNERNEMKNSYKITGAHAIRLALRDNLTIYCYANEIDDGGIVSIDAALDIIKEDPRLIYVIVQPCECVDADES